MKDYNRTKLLNEGRMPPVLLKVGILIVISLLVAALYNVIGTCFVSGQKTTAIAAVPASAGCPADGNSRSNCR